MAPSAADFGGLLADALEYLGGRIDTVVIGLDIASIPPSPSGFPLPTSPVKMSSHHERLIKFPFFVCQALGLLHLANQPTISVVSPPPDIFPLEGIHCTLNEVLLDRSLLMLAVASELSADGVNLNMRLFWSSDLMDKKGESWRGRMPMTDLEISKLHMQCARVSRVLIPERWQSMPGVSCVVTVVVEQ